LPDFANRATLDLVSIVVQDMPRALAFYRLLGLEIEPEAESEAHVEARTESGLRIAWDTIELIKSIDPSWTEPLGHRMGLAFLCDSAAEVDTLYWQVTEADYRGHKPPWDAFWGQRYATVADPDGNLLDLFAWL
jgi:catechol 2,3-dioxygenase-like lactoylglutathione lyase family enzyme